MNRQTLDQMWDQFRQKYGVYLRLLEAIPEARYASHPVPGMRTVAELVAHISGSVVRDIAQGVAQGRITTDESKEAGVAAGLSDRSRMLTFARECFEQASAAVATVGDAQLQGMVSTPWQRSFPGAVGFHIMNEEFVHHRAQLYVYARLFGIEPPFIWSYEANAPDYQPARAGV